MSLETTILQPEQLQLLRSSPDVAFYHDLTGGHILLEGGELVIASVVSGGFQQGMCYLGQARFNPTWVTIVRNLKAGDQLWLHWQSNAGANEYLEEAGLHADELHLRVRRSDRQEGVDDYLVNYHIAPKPRRMLSMLVPGGGRS